MKNTEAVVTYVWLVHIHFKDCISFSLQIITKSADMPAICQEYIQRVVNTVTCSYGNRIKFLNSLQGTLWILPARAFHLALTASV